MNAQEWNPFIPTKRDLDRTDELASKNVTTAGIITFLFFPAGLIYLNRGVNTSKIFGYTLILTVLLIVSGKGQGRITQIIALGAMTAEQVLTVKSAQKRKGTSNISLTDTSTLNSDSPSFFKPDDDAVVQLKELKYKYESNQISEEEFKDQKQRLLSSV
jgi:hypothetical protein